MTPCTRYSAAATVHRSRLSTSVLQLLTSSHMSWTGKRSEILDVRDPAHPQRIGMLSMPKATQIQVVGQLAYVTAEGVVQIVDISNPSHPIARGSIANANEVRDAQIVGQRAYLITFDQELQIVDVRDSTHTTPRGAMALSGIPQSVRVSDGIAYVATYSGGVQIVDVADPAHPSLIGTCVIQNSGPGCA